MQITGQTGTSWSIPLKYYSRHSPFRKNDPLGMKWKSDNFAEGPGTYAYVAVINPLDWQNWTLNPAVPSSDEIEIISPAGDFKFVLTYN